MRNNEWLVSKLNYFFSAYSIKKIDTLCVICILSDLLCLLLLELVDMDKIHITIEGNIGVGKSTVMKNIYEHFEKNSDISFAWEPVDEWEKAGFLEGMYDGSIPHTEFQYMVLSNMFSITCSWLLNSRILIQERSMDSAFEVFARSNIDPGIQFDMIENCYNKLKALLPVKTSRIYLRASPRVSLSRINKRARSAENSISREYLSKINTKYEEWLGSNAHDNTTIIDASGDIDTVTDHVIRVISDLIKS